MMQQYAGPLNPGDMAIRANELSPGISALLMKQMRNNAGSGIYQLPVAKQPNPDFYNSALECDILDDYSPDLFSKNY